VKNAMDAARSFTGKLMKIFDAIVLCFM